MRIRFVGQPFDENPNLHDVVVGALARQEINDLTVVTAWAKRSGLRRLEPELIRFRRRGGVSRIILGIDEGGATEQGIRLAAELFDDPYVFHDPGRRTFHAKLYIAKGDAVAEVFTGSNNFTAGGVYYNYEAADHIELDLRGEADAEYLHEIETYIDTLLSEEELCLPLDEDLLSFLLENKERYRIRNEDESREEPRTPVEPEDTDQSGGDDHPDDPSPFGRPSAGRRLDPSPPRDRGVGPKASPRPPGPGPSVQRAATTRAAPSAVERRWFKKLPLADAQQNTGNKTANLRLTQARLGIDWLTFFRSDLFVDAEWRNEEDVHGHEKEVAWVAFHVEFHGQPMGVHTLQVAHAPHRESEQRNHATVLHWGEELGAHLRHNDYHDLWVVIDRLGGGAFRLIIEEGKPSSAIVD